MIAGVGIDVVDVPGFRRQVEDVASCFVAGTFTPLELAEVASRPAADKTPHLAARYAAKEAFVKAWSAAARGHPQALLSVDLRQIEVVSDVRGRPSLHLRAQVKEAFSRLGVLRSHLSLSHDGPVATAMVVLERDASNPA